MQFITFVGKLPVVMSAEFVPSTDGITIGFKIVHADKNATSADLAKMFPTECSLVNVDKNSFYNRPFPNLPEFLRQIGAKMIGKIEVSLD